MLTVTTILTLLEVFFNPTRFEVSSELHAPLLIQGETCCLLVVSIDLSYASTNAMVMPIRNFFVISSTNSDSTLTTLSSTSISSNMANLDLGMLSEPFP